MARLGAGLMLLVATACGGDGDTATTSTSLDVSFEPGPEPAAVTDLGTPASGTARVVLGRALDGVFRLSTCDLLGDEDSLESVVVDGTAQVDGTDYRLEIRRFRTVAVETTITDTVTVYAGPIDAPAGALQAQRFEVNGLVTDARDPEATRLILDIGIDGLTGHALFAVPGAFADDGNLVEGRIAATC